MAYRIAICDDSAQDAAFVQRIVSDWACARQYGVQTRVFSSAEQFLFHYAEDPAFEILLLDIEMGAMDGVALARRVRQENDAVQIVFITGYCDYIADGYDVAALHYLMKPVRRDKLFAVLDRALEKRKQAERILNLTLAGELVRVPLREIRFVDVRQNYATVHARQDYTVKRTLGELEHALDGRFFRTGRSLIVNLDFIRRVTKAEVLLSTGEALALPRGAYESLNRAIIRRT